MIPCPICEASIPESEVRTRGVALCPACDATVRVERREDGWQVVGFQEPAPPDGLVVEVDEPPSRTQTGYREASGTPGRLLVRRRWWAPRVLFLTVFAVVWDGFLAFWYGAAFSTQDQGLQMICVVCFPVLHVVAGVVLTWHVVTAWLNRTTVEVREGRLTCTHAPLPMPFESARPVDLDQVELFAVTGIDIDSTSWTKAPRGEWRVVARMRDGTQTIVVTRLADERQAKFLARRLERQLG